ncbi:MAG: 1-acyl-sn-glycerol-3-phosphate acyltransferase [Deltaproteobacteria bacterium]|nr:1-acyl-sn-glycerol-3-phosphate acyltransferase [Deltaproteobacteria bacterium]
MTALRTIFGTFLGLLGLVIFTLFFGILTILFAWVTPSGRFASWCSRAWGRCWMFSSGVRVKASFEEALDPSRSYVFLSNHASWFDIPALLSVLPGKVRIAAKRGLFQVPIFGWALKAAGFISVDRGDKSQGRKVLAIAVEQLKSGGSVVFFPEGTRSPDGRLLPFQRGGLLLALKSGMPLVPVGISGSLSVMPRSTLRIRPGVIEVCCGASVDPNEFGLRRSKQLSGEIRHSIARLAKVPEEAAIDSSAPS